MIKNMRRYGTFNEKYKVNAGYAASMISIKLARAALPDAGY
ncbi:hypothetical protein [Thermithiobacillus plumbiphilus]|uniref:Uncharacterized protein n=1 Tax=Thermithiobacillus plumbiphilus TaxID=1729899 RepID=A0ABU9DAG9_9PROT